MVTGDDIRRIFQVHMGEARAAWLEPFDQLLRQLNVACLPLPGETAAIAFHNPKTAALCFDRIWAGVNPHIPENVSFRGVSPAETILIFLTALTFTLKQATEGSEWEAGNQFLLRTAQTLLELMPENSISTRPTIDQYSKLLTDDIGAEYGIPVVCVYASSAQRDREYRHGDRAAIVAVLENVPIVNENDLTWEQVLELRRDKVMLSNFLSAVFLKSPHVVT